MDLVREQLALSGGVVDESGPYPIIRGVLLCGLTSEHGYSYLPTAWTDEALGQYEGLDSYEGHKDGPRLPSEKVGVFHAPRRRADGRPEADYHLEPDHPLTPRLIRAARHDPTRYSLSHTAHVKWGSVNGKRVVEGFGRIHTADVVSRGGTTGGIFEHAPPGGRAVPQTVKEYLDKAAPRLGVERMAKALTLVKEDDYGSAPMPADAPAADADPDEAISAGFKAAIMAVVSKAMEGGMDPKAALAKIKTLLNSHGEATDGGTDTEEETGEEEAAEEAAKPAGKKGKVEEQKPAPVDPWELVRECQAEQFTATPSQLLALKGLSEKADRTTFIREQKGLSAAKPPKSQGRDATVKESGAGGGNDPPSGVEEARLRMAQESARLRGQPAPTK